jgi:hypothetical protein
MTATEVVIVGLLAALYVDPTINRFLAEHGFD